MITIINSQFKTYHYCIAPTFNILNLRAFELMGYNIKFMCFWKASTIYSWPLAAGRLSKTMVQNTGQKLQSTSQYW